MNVADLRPLVAIEVPGCLTSSIDLAILQAAREFCRRSGVWRAWLADIALQAAVSEYTPTPPADGEIVDYLFANIDGEDTDIFPEHEMDEFIVGWRTKTGSAVEAVIGRQASVLVYPIPTASGEALSLRASIMPTRNATTLPDNLSRWDEGLASGALARLKAMPGKGWTDREAVATHKDLFEVAINNASISMAKGFSKTPLRTKTIGSA